jgi:anaerobic selenocysteine-containing dehydrogenase
MNRIIPGIIEAIIKNKALEIRSDGKMVREYIYVKDSVDAYIKLAENISKSKGQAFNIAGHNILSVLEVVKRVSSIVGRPIKVNILNKAKTEIPKQYLDGGKMKEFFNWEPKTKFEEAWGVKLSNKVGLTAMEMMGAAIEGKMKAMYIMGENPVLSDPDMNHTLKALNKLDFLVVQDLFLTETAELADVVLPAASFAEKDGTFTNSKGRVQRLNAAIHPAGEARPEWMILSALGTKLGVDGVAVDAPTIFTGDRRLDPDCRSDPRVPRLDAR